MIPNGALGMQCYLVFMEVFLCGDARRYGSMGLALLQGEAVEQPLQLASADSKGLLFGPFGPAKATALQATIVEPEAVVVPVEDLELVSPAVAEDEEAVAEQIEFEGMANERRQTVDGLSHIGIAAGEIDGDAFHGWAQHGITARAVTTARSIAGSKPGVNSIAAPAMRTVTPPLVKGTGVGSTTLTAIHV